MAKVSGGTRLVAPGSAPILLENIAGIENTVRNGVTALYENNQQFKQFLLDAAKDNFIIHEMMDNGSIVEIHRDTDTTKVDYNDLLNIAKLRAKEDASIVQLTPALHYRSEQYSRIYSDLVGTQYERKCPDIKIIKKNGRKLYEEYESYVRPVNDRKVSNMLTDGLRQSSRLIIDVRDGIKMSKVMKGIKGRIGQYNIKTISVYDGTKLQTVYTGDSGFLYPYKSWNK